MRWFMDLSYPVMKAMRSRQAVEAGHRRLVVDPEGHLPLYHLVALLQLRVEVVGEDASPGLGADVDPKHLPVATEPVPLAKDSVIDEFAVHESSLVD